MTMPPTSDHATAGDAPRPGNIIAVASGKGGVGKTWLSITLAHLFARAGRRVLLFDGDIGLANVDVQLGITPTKDLGAVFFGGSGLADVIHKLYRRRIRYHPRPLRLCRARLADA